MNNKYINININNKKGNNNVKKNNILLKIFILCVSLIFAYKFIMSEHNIFTSILSFMKVIKPVLFAILLAYLLYIPQNKIEKFFSKSKVNKIAKSARTISIILVYLILFLIIFIAIKWAIPFLYRNIMELIENLPTHFVQFKTYLNSLPADSWVNKFNIVKELSQLENVEIYKNITNELTVDKLFKQAYKLIEFAQGIFNFFVTVVVSIYMLYSRDEILKFILKIINAFTNRRVANTFVKYTQKINEVFFNFVTTQVIDGLIVGIIISITLLLFKIKYAVALGMLIGIFNLIPYFGAIFAVGIATLITLITGGVSHAILILILTIIIQQLDANILNPILLGNSLEINKILIISSVMIGGAYFGPLGMFLAVPIVTILSLAINEYIDIKFKNKKVKRILTPKKKLKLIHLKFKNNDDKNDNKNKK